MKRIAGCFERPDTAARQMGTPRSLSTVSINGKNYAIVGTESI